MILRHRPLQPCNGYACSHPPSRVAGRPSPHVLFRCHSHLQSRCNVICAVIAQARARV